MIKYVAFLRGINVGGHTVKKEKFVEIFSGLGFQKIKTVIASGNILFETGDSSEKDLEQNIEITLEKELGFSATTMIRSINEIKKLLQLNPFKNIEVTKNTRLYVTFLSGKVDGNLELPYESPDKSFQILGKTEREVFSALNLKENGQTTKVMEIVEKTYGKSSTTRNWNTIEKIASF